MKLVRPPSWLTTPLKELARVRYGKGLPKRDRNSSGNIGVYGSSGQIGTHDKAFVTVPIIIVGRKGNAGHHFIVEEPCWPIDTVYYLEDVALELKYLDYYLNLMTVKDSSTAIPSLRRPDLEQLEINHPSSTEEQERIVSEIEKHFTRLDVAVASLRVTKEKLQQYRQSVLKAAFELPESDKGHLKALTSKIGSGSTPRGGRESYLDEGVAFIRSMNVRMWEFKWDGIAYISEETHQSMRNTHVQPEDVLLNITGASIGRVAMVPSGIDEANVNQHVSILRTYKDQLNPRYLMYWLSQASSQRLIEDNQKGVTRPALTKKQIENFQLPVPSLDTQCEVVEAIESVFSVISNVSKTCKESIRKSELLRKSILKSAFSGKLVKGESQ